MPHKLLLADDSVTIQRVIELTFADEDVEVIAVGDGREAIKRIEADPPDIVLADIGMPEKDGYEVAAFVKNSPKYAHIPVLLLTGAFEPVDEQRAQDVGCDGVLAKPFEPQMVITRVNELLAASPPRLLAAPHPPQDPPAAAPVFEPPAPRHAGPAFEPPAPRQAGPSFEHAPRRPAPSFSAPPPRLAPAAPWDDAPTSEKLVPPPVTPAPAAPTPRATLDAFLSAAPEFDLSAYGLGAGPAATVPAPGPPAPPTSVAEPADDPAAIAAIPAPALPPIELPEFDSGRAPAAPEPETSEAREMLESPSVRISRRTPIAIPGFGAPALPTPGTQAELDDYFEKLDAAFASLNQAAPPPLVRPAAVVPALDHPGPGFAPPLSHPPSPGHQPVPPFRAHRHESALAVVTRT